MFILDHNSPDPLYAQLARQIRERVLSGRLPAGAKLPSVRDLAAELSVSRNTVENTYLELTAEGYVHARARSGYFVSALDHEAPPPTAKRKLRGPDAAPGADPGAGPPCRYDFHPAKLDPHSFPAPLWRKYYLECLRESSGELARYGDGQGERELRQAVREYLDRSRGVACSPEQIVVCSGLQHALGMAATLVKDTHPRVGVENPGYFLPRSVLRNNSLEVVPVAVGPGGMDIDALKDSGSRVAYVTPSHQFPLGHVMPVGTRLKLIDWARAGGNVIIEDDYDSELRYQGKPIPSLQGLHPEGDIIYLGTFSKILSPALRLSYMVLPRSLLARYHELFRHYQAPASLLEQRTLARFMAQGHWDRHIRRMRTGCKKKHNALLRAVDAHFGDKAEIIGQGAGLHVVLRIPGMALGERELIRRAGVAGIRLFPFSETLDGGGGAEGLLLLGFGSMAPEEIDRATRLLAGICLGRDLPDTD
ncbi:PLP-dependent aminotransferase family protein [Fundidesulfovibrio terrae]|uniref:MocR-like pyridoxine biosynthesis transcription factor PdxR n=1 Tax=Fundidesulfovibrio terrae TaxID=2922866 RepID=UPI001FAF34DD|nr:PLP-dependent aminotransferase family protein [Fundidesulfovibrio terrae]